MVRPSWASTGFQRRDLGGNVHRSILQQVVLQALERGVDGVQDTADIRLYFRGNSTAVGLRVHLVVSAQQFERGGHVVADKPADLALAAGVLFQPGDDLYCLLLDALHLLQYGRVADKALLFTQIAQKCAALSQNARRLRPCRLRLPPGPRLPAAPAAGPDTAGTPSHPKTGACRPAQGKHPHIFPS